MSHKFQNLHGSHSCIQQVSFYSDEVSTQYGLSFCQQLFFGFRFCKDNVVGGNHQIGFG